MGNLPEKAEPTPSAQAPLASSLGMIIQSLVHKLPNLSSTKLQQALKVAFQLPEKARLHAFRIIAGKMSFDLAVRFLASLDGFVTKGLPEPQENQLDLADDEDMEALDGILELWSHVPNNLSIDSDEAFSQFLKVTVGLQLMISAAPKDAHISWMYDGASQYRHRLPKDAHISWMYDGASQYRHRLQEAKVLSSVGVHMHLWLDEAGAVQAKDVRTIHFSGSLKPFEQLQARRPIQPGIIEATHQDVLAGIA